ncbi:hypothetical protein D3C73_1358490 [compost metagenome]
MPYRFPGFFGDQLFFGLPKHHGAVFFDQIIIVTVLADRDHAAIHARVPGVGRHIGQVGVGLRVCDGHWLQAAVDHVADGQQKLPEDKGNVDEQLFFDFDQQVLVGQLQGHRNRFVGFTQLFDDFFHVRDPLACMARFIWGGLYSSLL